MKANSLTLWATPVPRVGETFPKNGAETVAHVTKKEFTPEKDTWELDLTSAYPADGLLSLSRRFEFERAAAGEPNSVKVTDRFQMAEDKPAVIETAVITFANEELLSEGEGSQTFRLTQGADAITVTVRCADDAGHPIPIRLERKIVGETDDQVPKKPTRLGFSSLSPVTQGIFTTEITPILKS